MKLGILNRCVVVCVLAASVPSFLFSEELRKETAQVSEENVLTEKEMTPKFKEDLEKTRSSYLEKHLPGGVLKASRAYKSLKIILARLSQTTLVDSTAIFNLYFASAEMVNAWIAQEHSIDEAKVYHVMVSKGLLDLFTGVKKVEGLPEHLVEAIEKNSGGLIAAVLAHELGHAMNGDHEKVSATTGVYSEFDADEFAVRLLAAAGYDPESVIHTLELLGHLHKEKSLRHLLLSAFDEHPKSKYRISYVEELVMMLKQSNEAARELGFAGDVMPAQKLSVFERDLPREKTSKTSLHTFREKIQKESYKNLDFREKINFLERYILESQTKVDGNLLHLVVPIIHEYRKLLDEVEERRILEMYIESLRRFENTLLGLSLVKGPDKETNAKNPISQLKMAIVQKQLLWADHSWEELLEEEVFYELADSIDARALLGNATALAKNAEEVEQLAQLLQNYYDYSARLSDRFRRSKPGGLKHVQEQFISSCVVRVLHLTQNMEETLDFIQQEIPVLMETDAESRFYPYFDEIAAALLFYASNHSGLEWGRFHERLATPKTALDRIFAKNMYKLKNAVSSKFKAKIGAAQKLDPMGEQLDYGSNTRVQKKTHLDSGAVEFFIRALPEETVQTLYNYQLKDRFTLEEVLISLEERSASPAFWQQWRPVILDENRDKSLREMTYQLKLIEQFFLNHQNYRGEKIDSASRAWLSSWVFKKKIEEEADFLSSASAVQKELVAAYRDSTAALRRNAISLRRSYAGTAFIKEYTGEETAIHRRKVPELSDAQKRLMNSEEKLEYLEQMLEAEVSGILKSRVEVESLQNLSDEIVLLLDEWVEAEVLTPLAKEEFMALWLPFVEEARDFVENDRELEDDFYVLRRLLRTHVKILEMSQCALMKKMSEKNRQLLYDLVDRYENENSQKTRAMPLMNALLVGEESKAVAYLKDPVARYALGEETSELAQGMASIMARFQGLGPIKDIDDAQGLLLTLSMARDIRPGTLEPLKLQRKTTDYSGKVRKVGVTIHKITSNPSALLDEEVKDLVLPLGEGFREVFDHEFKVTGSRVTEQSIYEMLIESFWSHRMAYAAESEDPLKALVFTLSHFANVNVQNNEKISRFFYVMLMRSLERVQSKEEMESYVSLLALYFKDNPVGVKLIAELMSSKDEKALLKVTAARYREHYYNRLIEKINHFDAWSGEKQNSARFHLSHFMQKVYNRLYQKIAVYKYEDFGPLVLRLWGLRSWLKPLLIKSKWYQKFFTSIQTKIQQRYSQELMRAPELEVGGISQQRLLTNMRENTPWSKAIDQEIFNFIREGRFEKTPLTPQARRDQVVNYLMHIRSFDVRAQAYRFVMDRYGDKSMGLFAKGMALKELLKAYREAERIWTDETLREMERAPTLLAKWKVKEKAWEEHAKKRAAAAGVSKIEADQMLMELYQAKQDFDHPFAGEVARVFPEGSRHRDDFLEEHAKKRSLTQEMLRTLEGFKSKNTETPYHKIAKALFELQDEYVQKLEPLERAEVVLYLAGFQDELSAEIQAKLKKHFHGSKGRKKVIQSAGAYLNIVDLKMMFREAHAEERAVAFKALFVGADGMARDKAVMDYLAEEILMSDPNMPEYLRKLLKIYLKVLKPAEASTIYSALLAKNQEGHRYKGPEILSYIVEQGGAVPAKLAQLVASHGFRLNKEYQDVLEKFKGSAQSIDKVVAFSWLAERLPEELYSQIRSLDAELGSGSLKIAYLATLRDGRKVVIKFAREFIHYKTVREFEIMREMLEGIMRDPDMAIDNLPGLEKEVERIIAEELKFKKEFEYEVRHREAVENIPLVVRLGSTVPVHVPRPLEGWQFDDIMVEEFVPSKGFTDLPKDSLLGWSQEKLSKAAIDAILQQLLSYMNPDEQVEGRGVLVDIDPHEENQLAKSFLGIFNKKMVNIDLGQSVWVKPELARRIAHVLLALYQKNDEEATRAMSDLMIFKEEGEAEFFFRENAAAKRFQEELSHARKESSDPIEILVKAMEEVELEGSMLKSEYLFLQKLLATMVGLKRHVKDPNYIMKKIKTIVGLRLIVHPVKTWGELEKIKAPVRAGSACDLAFENDAA